MGASASRQAQQIPQPEDIGEFRKFTGPVDQFIIPEVPKKRKVTDFKFTVIFGICLVVLIPFVIYSFTQTDAKRLYKGYDNCGNFCGENNTHVDGIPCSGKDMTKLPYLRYEEQRSDLDEPKELGAAACVENCPNSDTIIQNKCFPSSAKDAIEALAEISAGINKSAGYIVLLCFIGLGLSIGMLLLFRYFVAVVVWVMLIGSLTAIIVLTVCLWVIYSKDTSPSNEGLRYAAVFFTVLSIILIIMLICMFKRIKLVIRLFKEAIKIVFGIPLILFEPLLTFLANTILLIVFAYFLLMWLGTSGTLQSVGPDKYDFVPNAATIFTACYHFVICLWMCQFIIGCQHMVLSGAVSAYYFARDKSSLSAPIYNSFYNLMRYHLGTVAFGSLILTMVALIKAIIRGLVNNRHAKVIVDCCLGAIEDFLKYLSKNAYIQTAMHGQPFYNSGKRAVRLLAANAISAVAVNSVGDFVLNMAKVLIIVCTVGIGMLMDDGSNPYFVAAVIIGAIVTAIIADCFFSVFETAVDTIFLCFCEDNCMNDGQERPYYMSTNLMQYMEDAKKTVKEKERQ